MSQEEKIVRNQFIIISLVFLVLIVNVVLISWDSSRRRSPTGEFTAAMNFSECYIIGLRLYGEGDSLELSAQDISSKKNDYAHLYCNGKFSDDPPDASIPGLGCNKCRPYCSPVVTELNNMSFNETLYGVISSQNIAINCT